MYNLPMINDQYEQITMLQHQQSNNSYYFDPRNRFQYHQSQQIPFGAAEHTVAINPQLHYAQTMQRPSVSTSMMSSVQGGGSYLLYNSSANGMAASTIADGVNCSNSPGTGGSGNVNLINNTIMSSAGGVPRPRFGYDDCYKAANNGNTCFVSKTTNSPSFCTDIIPDPYMIFNCAANENTNQRGNYRNASYDRIAQINQSIIPKLEKCSPEPAELSGDFFCSVPGRLSLLSSTSKYRVSISEIHRRISQPECLNASLLGGILRRAKSKNGGKLLRQRLESIGVRLPAGRRKAATITVLTAMVEGEALQLASDYDSVCKADFPAKECAKYLHKRKYSSTIQDHGNVTNSNDSSQNETLLRNVKVARKFAEDFVQLLHDDRSPTTNQNEIPILDETIQGPLRKFSMVTHGFGIPAITTAVDSFISYLLELEENIVKSNSKRAHHKDDTSMQEFCVNAKRKRSNQ